MPVRINIDQQASPDLRALLDKADEFPILVLDAMVKALERSALIIVGNAVLHRFTEGRGPFPHSQHKLGRVTGRLRQSITTTKPRVDLKDRSVSMGFGSNVKYFGIHEFGFTGTVQVAAHRRKAHTIPGRNVSRLEQAVRAHSRKVDIKARAPMRTELEHERTEAVILTQISRALQASLP